MNKKLTIQELNQLIIDNFMNKDGVIDISGMKFDCDVNISNMIVDGTLTQEAHAVSGYLHQSYHIVGIDLYQGNHVSVDGNIFQNYQEVYGGESYQKNQKVKGKIYD